MSRNSRSMDISRVNKEEVKLEDRSSSFAPSSNSSPSSVKALRTAGARSMLGSSSTAFDTAAADESKSPFATDTVPDSSDNANGVGSDGKAKYREVPLHMVQQIVTTSWLTWLCGLWVTPEVSNNVISTSKYTLLTFLPLNLFEQFMRIANLYFLLMAGLQLIPGLSPTSWFTTVFPLAVVLGINAIKEGYDDYHRHKNDNEINSRTVLVLNEGGQEIPVAWRDVMVGDLVKVRIDEEVPADLVLLSSSDTENVCYVETANLDGETNLKHKYCFAGTIGATSADDLKSFAQSHIVRCELPNPKLYAFDGAICSIDDPDTPHKTLTVDNLVLRGCTLRKTNYIIGVAVFTGCDTKIMMNRTPAPRKVTQLERHMNILVLTLFGILFFFSCMLAMGDQIVQRVNGQYWYLEIDGTWPDFYPGFPGWVIQVIRFLILLNGFIPISLYVTLEITKVFQCVLVFNPDRQMYHHETDTPFNCRTTTLNEDLGQVQYVLSDKTGTLTQNIMGFVWASVGGNLFGKYYTSGAAEAARINGTAPPPPKNVPLDTPHTIALDPFLCEKLGHTPQVTGDVAADIVAGKPRRSFSGAYADPDSDVHRFFINLALCNTVLPSVTPGGQIQYQASSPDEEALVQGAAYAGYRLVSRSTEKVIIEYHGQTWTYQVLALLEFNSDRKRMSIMCRCPDGRIRLFCKGADTVIMTRVKPNDPNARTIRAHLEEMAQNGYRTLVIAEKELTDSQYVVFSEQYHAATVALEDRDAKIAGVAERIEKDMVLVGATAVEDKLQEGVPEAIDTMLKAGIKVWVLTGDKVETAINIALSCRLFMEDMALVELRERDFESCHDEISRKQVLDRKLEEVECEVLIAPVGLVVEGGALAFMLAAEYQDQFVHLCRMCKSVVCCRVSPMQKANVAKLVRKKMGAITLGIGDGANDVGMIQASHIGVGISGREGRSAVLASDYSFAQFRYLSRLLLIHGRASYKRNMQVVTYCFYKNWVFNMTYVYFAFVSAFSAQPLYTSGLISTLNLFWSSYIIVCYAVLEQDVSGQTMLQNPGLYQDTMLATRADFMRYQLWYIIQGTWHSLVVYFLPVYVMNTPDYRGLYDDWVGVGCTIYTAIVIVINLKLSMNTRYWTLLTSILTLLSVGLWFPFMYLYGLVWVVAHVSGTADMSDVGLRLFSSSRFWLAGVLLAPVMSLVPDFAYMAFQRTWWPRNYQIFQEVEYKSDLQDQAMKELGLVVQPQTGKPARFPRGPSQESDVSRVVEWADRHAVTTAPDLPMPTMTPTLSGIPTPILVSGPGTPRFVSHLGTPNSGLRASFDYVRGRRSTSIDLDKGHT